jgi:6,7-dimethyl-8-ribityllumazine synthase
MASYLKNLSTLDDTKLPDADDMVFGIVVSDWNKQITHNMYDGCYNTFVENGVKKKNIHTIQVPGAFELPVAAKLLLHKYPTLDAVVCLGCVIKGDTKHDEYINQSVAVGLTQLSLGSGKPVIFGVLTTNDEQQAIDRAGGKHGNKGIEAAVTAIRMADLRQELTHSKKGMIGF